MMGDKGFGFIKLILFPLVATMKFFIVTKLSYDEHKGVEYKKYGEVRLKPVILKDYPLPH